MRKDTKYKIAVGILVVLVIMEGLIIVGRKKPQRARVVPARIQGRIAIVLDDWGYNLNNLPIIEQIKYPLTCSVLPHLSYSGRVAEELHSRGFEVILHLPMEPREKYRLEKNTILTSFGAEQIQGILDGDLESIVYAKGVSNHMGSRATEDEKTMGVVFKELKNRKLYFLDSLVSAHSVASGLARKMGLPYAKRDVFLDNQNDAGYIKGQILVLVSRARARGSAIGIGHDRKTTLEVLKEVMPQIEKEGFRFVFVSELVR